MLTRVVKLEIIDQRKHDFVIKVTLKRLLPLQFRSIKLYRYIRGDITVYHWEDTGRRVAGGLELDCSALVTKHKFMMDRRPSDDYRDDG